MSKRFTPIGRITAVLCAVFVLLLFVSLPAYAANTVLRISKVKSAIQGQDVYVSINLENQNSLREFGGFDFLIGYDAAGLTLQQVIPGELIDSCGWEYFTFRTGPFGNCAGTCPSGMLRVVALAETNNGNTHPWCFFGGKSGSLAWMKFRVTEDTMYNCVSIPINFYWTDCGDNVLASLSGDTLYLERRTFESFSQSDITGQPGYGGWQGILGSPDCFGSTAHADTVIDFYNGEVTTLCSDSIDMRGDINLNGISNEISDLVMFCNYFLYGLSAFTHGNYQAATAASDINADGIPLSYRDLTYLCRIVYGDAVPFPKPLSGDSLEAIFNQNVADHQVEISYSGELAGAYIVMSGNIVPAFSVVPGFLQDYHFDGSHTRILILGDPNHHYGSGIWFSYQGSGTLQSVETADWFDHQIVAHITSSGGLCGDVNLSGNYDISDIVYLIRFIFGGGNPPLDGRGGDVNCDNTCDVSDAVYMLQFIFAGFAEPCSGCK